jgi:TPR repeat protein
MHMKFRRRVGLLLPGAGLAMLAALHLPFAQAGGPIYEEGLAAFSSGDIATAYQLWEPLAEHGDADAQFALASLYYDGVGVPVDHAESSYWFLLAAKQGHGEAQYNLGNAYKRGEGVRQSDAMAVQWWKKAAEQGLTDASYNVALAYQEGAGVPKDEQTAARYFREAAAGNQPDASATPGEIAQTDRPALTVTNPPEPPSGEETRPTAISERVGLSRSTVSSSVATNQPAQSPNGAGCEDWLASQPPDAYTLQLMSTTHPGDIDELTSEYALSGFVVCRYRHQGQTRHALLIGAYADIEAANTAAADLPVALKAGKPWVRRFKDLSRIVVGSRR